MKRASRKGFTKIDVAVWLICLILIGCAGWGLHDSLVGDSSGSITRRIGEILFPGRAPFRGQQVVSILLVGVDERKHDVGRADTIILTWLNVDGKKAAMLSVPRDTRCRVPGMGMDKIAHAYGKGRVQTVIEAVQNLLGAKVDYYIKTGFDGIVEIVDAMGGVEIDVEKNMYYRDRRGGLLINLKKGPQRLNGNEAEQYVRFRADKEGDLGRMRRQKQFLLAAYRQLQSAGMAKISSVAVQVLRNVETDLSYRQLIWLAKAMDDVYLDNVKMEVTPGEPGSIKRISYLIPDLQETRTMVAQLRAYVSTGALGQRTARVEVRNGTSVKDKAAKVAEYIETSGYQVVKVGNADTDNYSTTKIFTTPEAELCAQNLAKQIGCSYVRLRGTHRLSDPEIVLIIGTDLNIDKLESG